MKLTVARRMALLVCSALLGIALLTGLGWHQTSKVYEAADFAHVNTVPALVALDGAPSTKKNNGAAHDSETSFARL